MRPQSIIRFEQAYLASIVVWGVNTALGWSTALAEVNRNFAALPPVRHLGEPLLIGVTLFTLCLWLMLWYFTARTRSEVAKWVVVVFFGLSAVGLPFSLAGFEKTGILPAVLNVVTFILNGLAVWMLFRPDASAWFRASDGSAPPPPLA
ncbi:MAG: hypothetical protein KYX69_03445 [Sphingomonas sp.]|uniref:hypothetical protein n=1 Tax=Sphingomonas sp. TaxID=28214 RepID=UPI0026387E95|nr:hypothetical protein [Sphingomonas sp.]MDK2766755.1 hypothetical protein [Sphingomonas sp.]